MCGQHFEDFRLRVFGGVECGESGAALFREDALLKRELGGKPLVDLDPIFGVEQRKADREWFVRQSVERVTKAVRALAVRQSQPSASSSPIMRSISDSPMFQ